MNLLPSPLFAIKFLSNSIWCSDDVTLFVLVRRGREGPRGGWGRLRPDWKKLCEIENILKRFWNYNLFWDTVHAQCVKARISLSLEKIFHEKKSFHSVDDKTFVKVAFFNLLNSWFDEFSFSESKCCIVVGSVSSQSKFFDSTDLKSVARNRLDLSRFSAWNRLGKYRDNIP